MHFFVLIFMLSFLITGFEGLPPIHIIFTGSLQGRIDLQGFLVSYTGFGFAVWVEIGPKDLKMCGMWDDWIMKGTTSLIISNVDTFPVFGAPDPTASSILPPLLKNNKLIYEGPLTKSNSLFWAVCLLHSKKDTHSNNSYSTNYKTLHPLYFEVPNVRVCVHLYFFSLCWSYAIRDPFFHN